VVLADRRRDAAFRSSLSTGPARDRVLLGVLVALPVLQALGTNNPPLVNIVNGFAAWVAVAVAVLTGIDRAPVAARVLTAAVTAAAVCAAASIATGGLWWHPYRIAGNDTATAAVPGAPALSSLRLDPATAGAYAALRRDLAPYLIEGRPTMAFDTMAGIVLLLGGRPVGEAWYPARDPARTAAGIIAECTADGPWTPEEIPLLLFNRPPGPAESRVLRRCGLTFATDYRLLGAPDPVTGLRVYVPVR
jgi:hypothetical protein